MKMKTYSLQQISEINSGYLFRTRILPDPKGDVHAIQIKDIEEDLTISRYLSPVKVEANPKPDHFVKYGDLIFQSKGQLRSIYIKEVPEKTLVSSHFFIIRPKTKKVLPEYLSWLLNQDICQHYFYRNTGGSSIQAITKRILENTPIPTPSLEKQSTLNNLIQAGKKQKKLFHELQDKYDQLIYASVKRCIEI